MSQLRAYCFLVVDKLDNIIILFINLERRAFITMLLVWLFIPISINFFSFAFRLRSSRSVFAWPTGRLIVDEICAQRVRSGTRGVSVLVRGQARELNRTHTK